MDVAKLKVARTYAGVVSRDTITAGLGGATISVEYAPGIWDGLTKTVVFRGSVSKDVITNDTTIKIPPEVLTEPNKRLRVGFCGMDHKNMLVIPTIWADLGLIQPGADPSGDTSTDPSLPVWAQIVERVDELADEVEGLKQSGEDGPGTPGKPGEDGGYYTPSVSQPDPKSIQFSYTPSKPTMPAVEPETITLPVPESGGNAVQYVPQVLTPEQQIQARENIGATSADEILEQLPSFGSDAGIELIETIVLAEDTSSIVRDVTPDGSPYRFKSIFAMINMWQTLSNKWVQMAVTYDRDLYGTGAYVVNEGICPNKRIAWHKAVSNSALGVPLHLGVLELDGVVFHLEGMGSVNSVYHNTTNLSMANALFYNVHQGQIQSLEINSEVPLVANTEIYLFGVSA